MRMMSIFASVLSTGCLAVGCSTTPGPVTADRHHFRYTIEEFLDTTSMSGASFSPDEQKILVSSDESGVFNAYSIAVADGRQTLLTDSTDHAVFTAGYFPHDERFIYTSDEGGNELTHVHVRNTDGSVRDVTPGDGLKARFLGWAYDEQSFFVGTNERDTRFFDVYEVDADTYDRELIFRNEDGYQLNAISRDKQLLAVSKSITRTDTNVYLYDRRADDLTLLTPHEGEATYSAQTFSPDGKNLYLITDDGDEFKNLVRHDLATGDREMLVREYWDVWYAELSREGTYLVVGINANARTEVRLYDTATMEQIPLPDFPYGDIVSVEIARSEKKLAFYLSGSRAPGNLYVYDLTRRRASELTQTLSPLINSDDLVDAEVVSFRSYDGVKIPGLLYRPHDATPDNKAPALVWVHGGPGGQSRIGYRALLQYLVNSGYVVFAINNRGSSGYGRTFFVMDDRKHGDADLDDCVASKQFLVDQGYVDPDRIGIIGGSYGGYMVLAALAFRPDAFAIGVDIFGVSNWVRTMESIPPWWEAMREALYKEIGDPSKDREYLLSISPLYHASNIQRPLLVLQGANDPRVLKVESDEIVAAARANGIEVQYIVFDDEGHGFRKKENQLRGYRAIRDFCDLHLTVPPLAHD